MSARRHHVAVNCGVINGEPVVDTITLVTLVFGFWTLRYASEGIIHPGADVLLDAEFGKRFALCAEG